MECIDSNSEHTYSDSYKRRTVNTSVTTTYVMTSRHCLLYFVYYFCFQSRAGEPRCESPSSSSIMSSSYAASKSIHQPRTKLVHQDMTYGLAADPDKDKGPGWRTVSEASFTKFTMKRSPPKKYMEPGTSVICIHSKV